MRKRCDLLVLKVDAVAVVLPKADLAVSEASVVVVLLDLVA